MKYSLNKRANSKSEKLKKSNQAFLTKFERARIIGQRTSQLDNGSKPYVKVPEHIIDTHNIAELELNNKKLPYIIRRPMPNGGSEYWHIKDLENILY